MLPGQTMNPKFRDRLNKIRTLNFKEIRLNLGWLAAITKIRYAEIKKTGIVKRKQKQITKFERIPEESGFCNSLIINKDN
jgi:hypothetical protein